MCVWTLIAVTLNKHTEIENTGKNSTTSYYATIRFIVIPNNPVEPDKFVSNQPYVVTKLKQFISSKLFDKLSNTANNLNIDKLIEKKKNSSQLEIPPAHDFINIKYLAQNPYVNESCDTIKNSGIFQLVIFLGFGVAFLIVGLVIPLFVIGIWAFLLSVAVVCLAWILKGRTVVKDAFEKLKKETGISDQPIHIAKCIKVLRFGNVTDFETDFANNHLKIDDYISVNMATSNVNNMPQPMNMAPGTVVNNVNLSQSVPVQHTAASAAPVTNQQYMYANNVGVAPYENSTEGVSHGHASQIQQEGNLQQYGQDRLQPVNHAYAPQFQESSNIASVEQQFKTQSQFGSSLNNNNNHEQYPDEELPPYSPE